MSVSFLLFALARPANAGRLLISDFDDGTRTGWTTVPTFHGTLDAQATGGNPGGYMFATDNTSGGHLFVRYFAQTFDLRTAAGIEWDEFVFNHGSHTVSPTEPLLLGSDGTIYRHDLPLEQIAVWSTRSVDFQESNWTLRFGSSSFESVLGQAQIGFSMDTAIFAGATESRIDNVFLLTGSPSPSAVIPEPATFAMTLLGLLILAAQRRNRVPQPGRGD